jgi:hypothetical protein
MLAPYHYVLSPGITALGNRGLNCRDAPLSYPHNRDVRRGQETPQPLAPAPGCPARQLALGAIFVSPTLAETAATFPIPVPMECVVGCNVSMCPRLVESIRGHKGANQIGPLEE